jgi:gas vesicle protein
MPGGPFSFHEVRYQTLLREATAMAEEQEECRTEEEPPNPSGQGKKLFLVGSLAAAAGAIAALLLTPWRGSEAREKVKKGAAKAGSATKEGAAKAAVAAKEGAVAVGKAAKEKAGELADRARSRETGKTDSEGD